MRHFDDRSEFEQLAERLESELVDDGPDHLAGIHRGEIYSRIEKAVRDGQLESHFLSRFDSNWKGALDGIPEDIAKSYGIPRPDPNDELVKASRDQWLPWWIRLQRMAERNELNKRRY